MKNCLLLSLLLALGCCRTDGAPVEQVGVAEGSCDDAMALTAAGLALTKINKDRQEGYVFALQRLSNVHVAQHGPNGHVFYVTLDVAETNCSVLSTSLRSCRARPTEDVPVYGQCKAAIYISRVNRVVRLYKYSCVIRPVPSSKVVEECPDCPTPTDMEGAEVKKTVSLSLDKFNMESGLGHRFALLKVNRAIGGMGMMTHYNVEYTIQETSCNRDAAADAQCPILDCEFSHKGFCKSSLSYMPNGDSEVSVECEIFEPEAAEAQKKLHLLAGETDHTHNDTDTHDHAHDHAHAADATHSHDHAHDHTQSHAQHDHGHAAGHDHTHDHAHGNQRHAHAHSHDHGHGHDHVHSHHAKAHDHTGDSANHHHDYKHAAGVDTHDHDHEIALDHDHKHAHLHEHEHHHHHHDHDHETTPHDHAEGMVKMLPSMDDPMTLPAFPDVPAPDAGVVLPLKPDPQIPGLMEPTIEAFPATVSAQCAAPAAGATLVEKLFAEDPMFKPAA